jgi:hypothetical protein
MGTRGWMPMPESFFKTLRRNLRSHVSEATKTEQQQTRKKAKQNKTKQKTKNRQKGPSHSMPTPTKIAVIAFGCIQKRICTPKNSACSMGKLERKWNTTM